jgi:hypothetical protein
MFVNLPAQLIRDWNWWANLTTRMKLAFVRWRSNLPKPIRIAAVLLKRGRFELS